MKLRPMRRLRQKSVLLLVALAACALLVAGCLPPPPPPPIPTGFPNGSNTGVRAGTRLTAYTGPLVIRRCGVVINRKIIDGGLDVRVGNGTRSAATPCVTITNSLVRGVVNNGYSAQRYGPLVMRNVEIVAPDNSGETALTLANWYGWRLNIHGGNRGAALCDGYCELHNSFLHDYWYESGVHYDAFVSNGNGGRRILLDHNTLACGFVNPDAQDGNGGCSATVGLFGDFASISNVTVTRNLFVANPKDFYYCVYTGTAQPGKPHPSGSNNTWSSNTFQRGSMAKCGSAGPVYDWFAGNGNVWSGNVWDDGAPLLQ